MVEGKWENFEGGSDFIVDGKAAGQIHEGPRYDAGLYRAGVYPGLPVPALACTAWKKIVADRVTEAEAKKAVEEYWADKPAPTGYPYWAEDKPAG